MPKGLAGLHISVLSENSYPGRGIIVGLDDSGNMILVYWIMGRSENSRNRILVYEEKTGRVCAEVANSSKNTDTSLTIYNAMIEGQCFEGTIHVVSNGNQTDSVVNDYKLGKRLRATLLAYSYEPDEPHFTPRITAMSSWVRGEPFAELSILRKSPSSKDCDRHFYGMSHSSSLFKFEPGLGCCMTTYSGNGNPLPSFKGNPYLVPLRGDIETIADTYWKVLNPDNKVSLAVKCVPRQGSSKVVIRNKYMLI